MNEYYLTNEQSEIFNENTEENKLSILESLPFILSSVYYELNELFIDLKNHLEFNENILITLNSEDDLDEEWDGGDEENEQVIFRSFFTNKVLNIAKLVRLT